MGNPFEKISEVGDVISRAVSFASSKREQIVRNMMNAMLLFVIFLVFGCLDFATLKFHAEYLTTVSYWATTLSKTIAGICAFNIGINLMWETELRRAYVLAFAIKRYEILKFEMNKRFEYFVMKVYNINEKKKAYVSQINKKIYWLNKLSFAKDRLLYSSDLPERQEAKKKNRYCIRRAELEALKDEEFINKNINSLKVRYIEVQPQAFELEIDGSPIVKGTKTVGNVSVGKVKATSSIVAGMLGFSAFITAFSLTANKEEFESQMERFLHYLLKCAEDVAIVLWQTFRGMLRTRKIISDELTQPYVGRNRVLLAFVEWELENQYMTLEHYNELMKKLAEVKVDGDTDGSEQYLEITEEELLKLKGGNESNV